MSQTARMGDILKVSMDSLADNGISNSQLETQKQWCVRPVVK